MECDAARGRSLGEAAREIGAVRVTGPLSARSPQPRVAQLHPASHEAARVRRWFSRVRHRRAVVTS